MSKFEHDFEIGFRDVGESNKLTNRALVGFLEDIAGMHSNKAGYGLNNIETTGLTWVLLNWKVRIFSRPLYGETIHISTWARDSYKYFTFRDFEVFDINNNLIAIASSKWVLMNAKEMSLQKISPELINKYTPELKKVFGDEPELNKLEIPLEYEFTDSYVAKRKDIDINEHVHNVSYIDIAYELLPEDVYKHAKIDDFEIMYKKETKLGETIKCFYSKVNSSHYIVMKTDDEKFIHCIIKLNETTL